MRHYFRNIYIATWTVLVGMALTLRHLFTKSVTLQYPDEKWELPVGARAQLFNNIDDCIGCNACANACPVDCIYIDTIKALPGEDLGEASDGHKKRLHVVRFDIDMSKCCYCALCTYPCPTECLIMTTRYENSVYHREDLVYHYSRYTPEEVKRLLEAEEKAKAEAKAARAAKAAKTSKGEDGKKGAAKPDAKSKTKTESQVEQEAGSREEN